MEVALRFFQDPQCHFFLFGPRGTGKTFWLRHNLGQALFVDLIHPEEQRKYKARPERLVELIDAHSEVEDLVIDEVQKVPELLDVVHSLIETRERPRFVMTGSSCRKLKRTNVNLLAGRALNKSLHPFLASEMGAAFDLENALEIGMLPLVVQSKTKKETLRAYLSLYMREEVMMEGYVRNVGAFSRFLEELSFSHGQVLNLNGIARDCGVRGNTVRSYIEILEDMLLAFRLPVFTKRAKRVLSLHPKFYWFDSGVFRSMRKFGPLDSASEIDGAVLEGLVAQHLYAWVDYTGGYDLYFWRTKSGREVDFIVYGDMGLWALEVKNGNKLRKGDLAPLKAFKEDYPSAELLFLYRGSERVLIDGVLCLPVGEFLESIVPSKPLL